MAILAFNQLKLLVGCIGALSVKKLGEGTLPAKATSTSQLSLLSQGLSRHSWAIASQ